jgi:hypothetical protein
MTISDLLGGGLLPIMALAFATTTNAAEVWTCTNGSTAITSQLIIEGNKLMFEGGVRTADIIENNEDHILAYDFVPSNGKGSALGVGTAAYTLLEKSSGKMTEFDDVLSRLARAWGGDARPRVVNEVCTRKPAFAG